MITCLFLLLRILTISLGTQSVDLVIVRGSIRKHRGTETRENAKGKTLEKKKAKEFLLLEDNIGLA